MTALLDRIARSASRHWRRSLAIAAIVVVGLGALAGTVGGQFSDEFSVPGTESQQALDLLQDRFPAAANEGATVVFYADDGTVRDGDRAQQIADARREISALPQVTDVTNPLAKGSGQVSQDGRVAFATVQYDRPAFEVETEDAQQLETAATVAEGNGLEVAMRGPVVDVAEEQMAPVGELVGIAVAVIVLTLFFGSFAAMLLTLISALIALGGGMMLLTLGAGATSIPEVAPTLAVMLGLGAGIDYALLIVGRYREHLAAGEEVPESAAAAGRTAGVSVLAAGAIVAVAIAGLLATGIPFVGRMGIATAVVVAGVALGAVTLLPALMGAFAKRLRPKRAERLGGTSRVLARWDERVTRRPWLALLGGVAVLLALAFPFTDLRLGQPDDGNSPQDSTTRIAYDKLAEGFGPGFNGTLQLAASLPGDGGSGRSLDALASAVERTEGVAAVSPPTLSPRGDAATITVTPTTAPQDAQTSTLVERLRDDVIPSATQGSGVEVYVGGNTATQEDMADKIAERLPFFIGAVVILSLLFLMAVFRSVWVPIVSAAFNLLSIAAAYGVVVAIFQWEWGSSLLGIDGEMPIVSFIPLFMFAILFGLSMDYNVFLQSRIREEYMKGASPRESVVTGLAKVSKLILAAGAIMTAVFFGFATDPDPIVKIFGVGLGVAILIDVLVVRMVVAPAVMTLLGDRAWWLPGWLDRLLPHLELEGESERPEETAEPHERDRRRPPLPVHEPAPADAGERG